jgi:peptide/nickel transport system permease protein
MPVLVIALYDVGYLIAMIRVSMIAVMRQPFIRTAVLKGMKRRDVILRHALRNALIAPFTAILLQVNYLVAGVVVVETVFAYPGFGRLMLQAAMSKDIAVVEAGTLVAVLIAMTTQLVGDLAYMLLDPRIRVNR